MWPICPHISLSDWLKIFYSLIIKFALGTDLFIYQPELVRLWHVAQHKSRILSDALQKSRMRFSPYVGTKVSHGGDTLFLSAQVGALVVVSVTEIVMDSEILVRNLQFI